MPSWCPRCERESPCTWTGLVCTDSKPIRETSLNTRWKTCPSTTHQSCLPTEYFPYCSKSGVWSETAFLPAIFQLEYKHTTDRSLFTHFWLLQAWHGVLLLMQYPISVTSHKTVSIPTITVRYSNYIIYNTIPLYI